MNKNSVVSLVLLSSFLGACSFDSTDYFGTTVPKHKANEVWLNNRSEPQWIDPNKANGVPDGHIARNIFARLTQIHPITSQPVPDLAEKWEISEDGTKYTFYIRESKWSDGQTITAHDFERSWKRLLNPATASVYASLGLVVKDSSPFFNRAVHVKGFAENIDVDALIEVLKEGQEIRIDKASDHAGLYVYIEDNDQRRSFIETYNGALVNGQELEAAITDSSVVKAYALDDKRFYVELEDPVLYFLSLIEFSIFAPVPEQALVRAKNETGNEDNWTRPEYIICSAAHCLSEEKFRQYKIFIKNPYYWDAKNTRSDIIKIQMVEKETTSVNFYRSGEYEWIGPGELPTEYTDTLKQYKDYHNDPYLGIYTYIYNVEKEPFTDPNVRKALSLAVDRDKITTHVVTAGQQPASDVVPDGLTGYKSGERKMYDPEEARRLLSEAGYPNGQGFPKVEFKYNTQDTHRLIAEAVQQMWKTNLNIDVELTNVEWRVYLDDQINGNFDITRQGWIGDFPDPYTFLDLYMSYSGNNHTRWVNHKYDSLVQEANRTADYDVRNKIFSEAVDILMADAPVLPIYIYTRSYLKKPFLKGFYKDYQDHHSWKYMWIDDRWYNEIPTKEIDDTPKIGS
ncbi:MAG: peptide ABC transporter substrate-binding protein [Bdellovibrionales bacterium]|nr:peptide ABC transporter substrate-binding protein [Bdellovibrionales bacterium]